MTMMAFTFEEHNIRLHFTLGNGTHAPLWLIHGTALPLDFQTWSLFYCNIAPSFVK